MSGYDNLLAEIAELKKRIAELEHQHINDEFANKILLDTIEGKKDALRPVQQ